MILRPPTRRLALDDSRSSAFCDQLETAENPSAAQVGRARMHGAPSTPRTPGGDTQNKRALFTEVTASRCTKEARGETPILHNSIDIKSQDRENCAGRQQISTTGAGWESELTAEGKRDSGVERNGIFILIAPLEVVTRFRRGEALTCSILQYIKHTR